MKRKMVALTLLAALLALTLSQPASAAGFHFFTQVAVYEEEQFQDVEAGAWYFENVQAAYELGLMKGSDEDRFSPLHSITLAEAVTVGVRLHEIYHNGAETLTPDGSPWYSTYMAYARDHGILPETVDKYNEYATRGVVAEILTRALPAEALQPRNEVAAGAIPDVPIDGMYAENIYRLYRAGVLCGNDEAGRFAPGAHIQRGEVAAMLTRMADPQLRMTFTLTVPEQPKVVYLTPGSAFAAPAGTGQIAVTPMMQTPGYPTGCESISTVMALRYAGVSIDPDVFIDKHLPMAKVPAYRGGTLYGHSPYEYFLGNPRSSNGYGCFAPVITKAALSMELSDITIVQNNGLSINELLSRYIDHEIPVVFWGSIDMVKVWAGPTWTLEGTNNRYTWLQPMHCLVLVGYDGTHYYFNDPLRSGVTKYKKSDVAAAYQAYGSQAVAFVPKDKLAAVGDVK